MIHCFLPGVGLLIGLDFHEQFFFCLVGDIDGLLVGDLTLPACPTHGGD